MPGVITPIAITGGNGLLLQQRFFEPGLSDWVRVGTRVQFRLTGTAFAVQALLERSAADPAQAATPLAFGGYISCDPSDSAALYDVEGGAAAWYRLRIVSVIGGGVNIALGDSTRAPITYDRTAPRMFKTLRLSATEARAGVAFTADILDRTAGSDLRLLSNCDGKYSLAGATLTGTGLRFGIDNPKVIETRGTSDVLGPRETEFTIRVAHA